MNLELRGVSVRHASAANNPPAHGAPFALADITLTLPQGAQVALIGPSGAGKTTLLHTLAAVHRPDAGSLCAFGHEPWLLTSASRHALRRRLFLAPQTPPLPPRQRVVTAVSAGRLPQWTLWQALASLLRPAEPEAAWQALARFNLQDKLYARVDRLSGGERQRCAMARLLMSNAEVFLVDEPLSALDPALALQTVEVLQEEATARRATLVCSLHQVDLARARFPRIIGLRSGRVVFDLPREAVTDAAIAALYDSAGTGGAVAPAPPSVDYAALVVPRCF